MWCLNAELKRQGLPKRTGWPWARQLAVPYTKLHATLRSLFLEAIVLGARDPALGVSLICEEWEAIIDSPMRVTDPDKSIAVLEEMFSEMVLNDLTAWSTSYAIAKVLREAVDRPLAANDSPSLRCTSCSTSMEKGFPGAKLRPHWCGIG